MTSRSSQRRSGLILLGLTIAVLAARPVAGQDSITWVNSSELSVVSTGGNSSASTLGLKGTLSGTKGPNTIKFEVGGIRSSIDVTTRTATGTPTSYTVSETTVSQVTAANYFARTRYDRKLDDLFAFVGAGWDRNTFAGVRNRYAAVVGIGHTFVDGPSGHFKADIGATYTIQKDVDPKPGADEGFGGTRLNVDVLRHLSSTADYASALIVDENLESTEDFRWDWTNSVSVALSEKLALKTSLQLLFDNQPALLGVPLLDTGGVPTGTTVSTPGDKLDRILTLTLVIKL